MADKARVLVVANRTAESPELLDALRARTAEGPFVEELRQEGLNVAHAKVGDGDPLAAIQDECNFNEYDELIVSTLPLKVSKWLRVDLPRKARAATGLPVKHVIGSEG